MIFVSICWWIDKRTSLGNSIVAKQKKTNNNKKPCLCEYTVIHLLHCLPPLPQPSTPAREKAFCGALLCHNLQTYFSDKAKQTAGTNISICSWNTLVSLKKNRCNSWQSGAPISHSVWDLLQTRCLNMPLAHSAVIIFTRKTDCLKKKNICVTLGSHIPTLLKNEFREGGGREGGKADRYQRFMDRGQRSRVADLRPTDLPCLSSPSSTIAVNGFTTFCSYSGI